MMFRLENPVRDYAWGSTWHIPKMCGLTQSDGPVAEMWFGAHAAGPSLTSEGGLDQLIALDPVAMLGTEVDQSFEGRLPYLMKLLAAAEPLSLQVHPTSQRARIRFAEQQAAGIPLMAPERSYKDASHKPELLLALTRFEGMAGFRDPDKTAAILRGLELRWLNDIADRLEDSITPFQTLHAIVSELLSLGGRDLEDRLQELRSASVAAERRSHARRLKKRRADMDPSTVDRESTRVYAATTQLIDRYPEDPGVLVTLLLNHVVLAAGEAMFIDAGVIHAYTSGFGLEIMAASDNVLRAGLTPKHVDVPELLEITNFTPMPPPRWASRQLTDLEGELLAPPVHEFELLVARARRQGLELRAAAQIVLCLEGAVQVRSEMEQQRVARGESVFVPASEGAVRVTGSGRVAVARPPA